MSKELNLLLAGIAWGQNLSGVEKGPEALWDNGALLKGIEGLGWHSQEVKRDKFAFQQDEKPTPVKGMINNSEQVGQALSQVARSAQPLIANNTTLLTLGGDHSIALATIAAALIETNGDLCVLWIDAHEDFNTPETSSTGKCHGMPLAALTHEFDIHQYAGFENFPEFPPLKSENLALIGIRDIDGGEDNKIHDSDAKIYTMEEVEKHGIEAIMDQAMQAVNPDGNLPIHLSYDIDALDPEVAPATGTRVPDGLSYADGLYIAKYLAKTNKIKSMDMVEVNPDLSGIDKTVKAAHDIILAALGD